MAEHDLVRLKNLLLQQRQEVFKCRQELEAEWRALSEPDIEREEEAQKADLAALFAQLDQRDQQAIEEIDQALAKMAALTYGTCEECDGPIPLERLEALPATRYCGACARKKEEQQQKPGVAPCTPLPGGASSGKI